MAKEFLESHGGKVRNSVTHIQGRGNRDRRSYCANSERYCAGAGVVSGRKLTPEEAKKQAGYYSR